MDEAGVKMLMQYKKWMVEKMAEERGLDSEGTKLQLARRIAKWDEEDSARRWRAIVDGFTNFLKITTKLGN